MRLCVHLASSIDQYYACALENVPNLRKTHRGREAMKQALKRERISAHMLRAGQQSASLLKLPARITTILQSKTTPTISIVVPLMKYLHKWLRAVKAGKTKLVVEDSEGGQERMEFVI